MMKIIAIAAIIINVCIPLSTIFAPVGANIYTFFAFTCLSIIFTGLNLLHTREAIKIPVIGWLIIILMGVIFVQHMSAKVINLYLLQFSNFGLFLFTYLLLYNYFKIFPQYCLLVVKISIISLSIICISIIGIEMLFYENIMVSVFGNIGILGILLSIQSVFIITELQITQKKFNAFTIFLYSLVIINVALIIYYKSRTGFITITLGLVIIFLKSTKFRKYTIYSLGVFVSILLLMIVYVETNSTKGRFLVLKVSNGLLIEHFPFGCGFKRFPYFYPHKQAEYYINGEMSKSEIMLADTTLTALCEPLQLICELGIFGLVFIVFILWIVFNSAKENRFTTSITLVSLIFSSLFYYSFHCMTILAILLIVLSSFHLKVNYYTTVKNLKLQRVGILIVMLFSVFMIIVYASKFNATLKFKKLQLTENSINQDPLVGITEKLSDNPMFLLHYAKLVHKFDLQESLRSLELFSKYITFQEAEFLSGINCLKLGKINEAEIFYKSAISICPNRFLPRFELFHLLDNQGDSISALKVARDIVELQEKVPSDISLAIKLECEEYINNFHK